MKIVRALLPDDSTASGPNAQFAVSRFWEKTNGGRAYVCERRQCVAEHFQPVPRSAFSRPTAHGSWPHDRSTSTFTDQCKIAGWSTGTMAKMAARYGHFGMDELRGVVEAISAAENCADVPAIVTAI